MHLQYLDKNPSLSVSTGLTIFVTHGLSFSFRNDYTIFFFFLNTVRLPYSLMASYQ